MDIKKAGVGSRGAGEQGKNNNAQCPLALSVRLASRREAEAQYRKLNSRTIKKIFNHPIRIFALRVVGWFVSKFSWRQT